MHRGLNGRIRQIRAPDIDDGMNRFITVKAQSGKRRIIGKRHTVSQRLVYWTALHDFCQALALSVVKVALDLNVADDLVDKSLIGIVAVLAIVGVNPGEIVGRTDRLERDPFVLTVVGQRDASTRG